MMNISKWQSAAITGNNLHPELVKLAAEIGMNPVRANGRNQCYLNSVWVGFYKGPWGTSPWQVGDARDCMTREALVALLTKDEEPAVTSPSFRNFTEVVEAKAKAEAPKPVASSVAAIVNGKVETPAEKIARLEAAVAAKKAAAAAAAVAATAEEAARIAELEAELAE